MKQKNMKAEKINNLRRRFVKDRNLPISIVEDDDLFNYYMGYYDFFPREDYYELLSLIEDKYNGNIEEWLNHYAKMRDEIICTIENSEPYKKFNEFDLTKWNMDKDDPLRNIPDMNIYNCSNIGRTFVSIDLKKANFQALKTFDKEIVRNCNTYEELIDTFGGDDYFKKSKYTRQVIFGKLNPKRTIKFESYLVRNIAKSNLHSMRYLEEYFNIIAIKSDEIVYSAKNYDLDVDKRVLELIKEDIKEEFGLDVTVTAFKMGYIETRNHNGTKVDGYVKHFLNKEGTDLKDVSSIFYPQIYAFYKGYPNNENNLYFKAEDQVAKFVHPLELIEIK